MMGKYDPLRSPDATEWLAMDEDERLLLVEDYHRHARIRMPNHRLHAAIHAVVENQIAEAGSVPTSETLSRLMAEGLDRHEALHAIGTVLAEHIHRLLSGKAPHDPNPEYFQKLKELTAEKWGQHAAAE